MKLPNGYGSVHKLTDRKRRKPWRARITTGYVYDEANDKQVRQYKILGYYETKQQALQALASYNTNPYDLDVDKITFAECYAKWTEEYFKRITPSAIRCIESPYKYCSSLYNIRMRDIRVFHLKECMNNAYIIPETGKDKGTKRFATSGVKSRMKSMFNLLFDYALEHEIVSSNYARNFNLDNDIIEENAKNKKEKIPFTNDEIKVLWDDIEYGFTDMILIQIYSGWRPQELCIIKLDDVDLKNDTMKGGLKTEAGKERIVPIHPLIKHLIEKRCEEAIKLNSEYLFNDMNSQTGINMTYDKYRKRFEKVMKKHNMNHSPHESRHTFITIGKSNKMDEYILKIIVGHSISDITEKVYTHRLIEQIKTEMFTKITKYITVPEE